MLRRCGVAATSTAGTVPALLWLQRRGLFGGWGKNATTGSSSSSSMPKLPMPFDLNKLRQMRDVLAKMPAERQKEIMDEFVALQKSTDKSEGLMQRVQKSAQLFEQLLQQAEQNNNSSSSSSNNVTTTSTTATAATTPTSRGPTLEQLRKIDLGSELEALFAELARMRAKKNEYRSKLAAAEAAAEQRVAELTRLRAAEADLRARLHRAEHQAMLLTSENVELSERAKLAKELTTSLHTTRLQLRQLQQQQQEAQADNGDSGGTLRQQLQSKDAALRSLQRKLDRMRRRDPLLQFSLACSDVRRLCNAIASHRSSSTSSSSSGAADDATTSAAATTATTNTAYASASTSACDEDSDAEVAFARLRSAYEAQQRAAWTAAAHADAAAARAYVAVLRACVRAVVPYAHYDAAVTVVGDADAARACIAEAGFVVLDDADSDGVEGDGLHTSTTAHANNNNKTTTTTTLCVCARDDAAPLHQQPGPYGYLAALQMAMPANMHASPTRAGNGNNNNNNSSASSEKADDELLSGLGFAVVHVRPRVSSTLLRNRARSVVTYETARASGPGGQATNVSETQVYARLAIDGAFAYHAEAQDSRSALSNRQAALTRLQTSRRVQYNDTLARQQRVEDVYAQLVRAIAQHGGLTPHDDVLACVRDARESGALSCLDVGLVRCMTRLAAAAERATTTTATRPTASNDDARDAAE